MIIAVDPGVHGAITWMSDKDKTYGVVGVRNMPATRRDTIDCIQNILTTAKQLGEQVTCFHEKVAKYIPGGGASQMFTFGTQAERVACIVETLGIRLIEIPPKEWQRLLNLGTSARVTVPRMPSRLTKQAQKDWKEVNKDDITKAKAANAKAKREWKNKLKAEAQRRYPDIKVTLGTADALLILSAAQRYKV